MLAEDVKIRFRGFEPTPDVRSRLDLLLDQLHLKAPNRSFLSVTVTLTNGIFEGVLKVSSVAENFVARATDRQVTALSGLLCDRVIAQLDKWKALRILP